MKSGPYVQISMERIVVFVYRASGCKKSGAMLSFCYSDGRHFLFPAIVNVSYPGGDVKR